MKFIGGLYKKPSQLKYKYKQIHFCGFSFRTIMSADEGCNVSTAGSSRPESRYGGDESHGSGSEDTGDDRVTSQLEHNLRQQENNEHTAYNLSSAPADCQRGPFPR
jgi:hypothetical protein